jgi:hypothetical protein
MLRERLRHPIAERRRAPRLAGRSAAGAAKGHPGAASLSPPAAAPRPAPLQDDLALAHALAAGGPLDRACYACSCGYVFVAAVSTDVNCPHCGNRQAW